MASYSPAGYAFLTYLHLLVRLDDGSMAVVTIDRYLNATITAGAHLRAVNADHEKDALLAAIAKELGVKGYPPLHFQLAGQILNRLDIQRVFTGKGSPSHIRTVLWLASHYGRTNQTTVRSYSDRYIGLDCNGFAGNYWGIDPTTEISAYDVHRRTDATAVATGDALVFYKKGVAKPYHIAVVDQAQAHGGRLALVVVQSAGLEQGLHRDDLGEVTCKKNGSGHLYFERDGGNSTIFIAAGPPKKQPSP